MLKLLFEAAEARLQLLKLDRVDEATLELVEVTLELVEVTSKLAWTG